MLSLRLFPVAPEQHPEKLIPAQVDVIQFVFIVIVACFLQWPANPVCRLYKIRTHIVAPLQY